MVTERTSSLHIACDRMMAHQTQIAAGAEQIRTNLYYYTQYDSIMKVRLFFFFFFCREAPWWTTYCGKWEGKLFHWQIMGIVSLLSLFRYFSFSKLQKLNSGKFAITGQVFTQILCTIDECLRFLRSHIHYKESAAYITKYEQCLSKYCFCCISFVEKPCTKSTSSYLFHPRNRGWWTSRRSDMVFTPL